MEKKRSEAEEELRKILDGAADKFIKRIANGESPGVAKPRKEDEEADRKE